MFFLFKYEENQVQGRLMLGDKEHVRWQKYNIKSLLYIKCWK